MPSILSPPRPLSLSRATLLATGSVHYSVRQLKADIRAYIGPAQYKSEALQADQVRRPDLASAAQQILCGKLYIYGLAMRCLIAALFTVGFPSGPSSVAQRLR